MPEWVTSRTFLDLSEAELALGALEASGLQSRLRDEHMAGLDWFYIPALGGIRLEVPEGQASEADEVLLAVEPPLERSADEEEEERAFLAAARLRKRAIGIVALLLILGPWMLLVGLVYWVIVYRRSRAAPEQLPPADAPGIS